MESDRAKQLEHRVIVLAAGRRTVTRPAALRIQFDKGCDKDVKSAEDNAKACTHVSDGLCRPCSRGGFTFESGGRS